ncbi:MAG TPA: hypothetical protein PKH77_24405 [Anaerolineae bacterium]|nr:hypothetical protein [Anaerolineae bacterium]
MSADRWNVCPKCKEKAQAEKDAARQAATEKYGKLPIAEWVALRDKSEQEIALPQTLREDWELGIVEDRFEVTYTATCSECKFKFKFEQWAPVP